MILSQIVIVGTLGAGTLGAVKYRDLRRKREFPWTVAAERIAKNQLPLAKRRKISPFRAKSGMRGSVTSSIKRGYAKSQTLTQEIIAPFAGETRKEQLQEITGTLDAGESEVHDAAKRKVVISSASLLCVSAGALFYTPLYVPGVLGIAYLYSFFFKTAIEGLVKERRLTSEALNTVLATGALAGGYFFVMGLACWYLAMIRWGLAKTQNHSRKNLVNLFGEVPRFVWVVIDGSEVEIPFENLQIGDQVVVSAGQMIPVDGTISAGMASIDQHMLTGEAKPFDAGIGQPVFASTIMLSGQITIWVSKIGQKTVAAQIGHILNNTADFNLSIKSRADSLVEKAVPKLLMLSALSLPWFGLNRALAMLWCVPGSRIFILGPMTMLNYLHFLSRQGVLIKDGQSLELLNEIDTIVFDKTGTLTQEMPVVSQFFSCSHPLGKLSEEQLLAYAAAAEYRQTHPIAKAILQAADMRQLHVPEIDDSHYEVGYGVKVNLNGSIIRVGSERFIQMCGITIPAEIEKQQVRCHEEGYSLVYVAINEQLAGVIELVPTIRPEVKEVIGALRESGKSLYIISGDHEAPTRRLAQALGIDNYFANTLPENKAELVKELQEQGRVVCFIGDGINDAIALKQAHVSISLRGATTVAMDTAQVVLMDGNLSQLAYLFEVAEEFNRNVNGAFMLTLLPKAIGMAGVLFFHWGLFTTLIFNTSFWLPQLSYIMLPLVKRRKTNK